jgi:hypothetical protein
LSAPFENVTWIRFEKPTFDLIGVVLSSFGITGICVGVALVLGLGLGLLRIRRSQSRGADDAPLSLGLHAGAS